MALKNWRPITLLTTLYKIISGTIAARVKKVLPHIIGEDQKGFVDGRYMGEVTRTLYDTIHDAWHHQKKGVLLSIDFEKAFDTVEHDAVWSSLRNQGVPYQYISLLTKLYDGQTGQVRIGDEAG